MALMSLTTLMMMVQKLSATDVFSSVGRLLVYTFVQSSIIKVIKCSFSIAAVTTYNSELFFAKLTISHFTEREPTAVPNTCWVSMPSSVKWQNLKKKPLSFCKLSHRCDKLKQNWYNIATVRFLLSSFLSFEWRSDEIDDKIKLNTLPALVVLQKE